MQAGADDAQTVNKRAKRYGCVLNGIVGIDCIDEFLALIGADGKIGNQESGIFS